MVIAVPVAGLLAGASTGVLWPEMPAWVPATALGGWAALAVHALRVRRTELLVACVSGAFASGGAALAVDAWDEAWRPSLRREFERLADAQHAAVGAEGAADTSVGVELEGVLRTDARPTPSGLVSLSVDADTIAVESDVSGAIEVDGGVLLTVVGALAADRIDEWRAGRRIRAPTDLRRPGRYLDPGVPDQERALARRGTTLVGTVKSGALVEVTGRGTRAQEWAAEARAFARRAVRDAVGPWSPRSAAIVSAILIGDRTGLDDEVERRLQEAGTYHVIAISGGNIAILAGLTLATFRVIGLFGRAAMLAAAAGLILYGYVVVGGASVTRATLMAVIYFLGRAWDLRGPPMHGLLLVAGVMTLVDPLSVADPATLLTFGATASIVWVAAAVPLGGLPRAFVPPVTLLLASAAAEAALLPVAATLFQRVTFAGLVLNFGAIPLMAVAQLAGLAIVPLHALWPTAARLAGLVAHVGAEGLVRTAGLVELAPWVTWRVAPPAWWVVALYYASAAGAWALWRRQRSPGASAGAETPAVRRVRRALAVSAAATAVWILVSPATLLGPGSGRLRITFIDVGQGDAALVQFPLGSSMLIDTGGVSGRSSFDVGDRVVGPVLRHLGVRRLDSLVLTHGDADHIGGALTVLREFTPWDVWEGVPVPADEPLQRLRRESVARRARWTTVQRTDTAAYDDVQVTVHHPGLPDWERQDVRNDDSIVIELRWHDVSLVFTGDVGREVEDSIVERFAEAPIRVVKVPHHGSTTSSSWRFVRALSPDVAVVSAGRGNPFGHPTPSVLSRYEADGAAIFRTDRDGAVTLETDGRSLDIRTHTDRRLRLNAPIDAHRGAEGLPPPRGHDAYGGLDQ